MQARRADQVWLATDLDREGESIAWHIAEYAGLGEDRDPSGDLQRDHARAPSTRPSPIPASINLDLVNAQQARRIIDRLVGYKLSPLVSSKIRRGLSAGRVQSVAVRLVVDREREIEAFVPEEYWTSPPSCGARRPRRRFAADLTQHRRREGRASAPRRRRASTRTRCAAPPTRSPRSRASQQKKGAPPPFTTSTLQQEASRKLGFAARRTMSVAQSLYEGVSLPEGQVGLITYMRTDSVTIGAGAVAEARDRGRAALRQGVRAGPAECLQDEDTRRAGGARGDSPVELRPLSGVVGGAPQARRAPPLRPDLEARPRHADGAGRFDQVGVDVDRGPIHPARRSAEADLRRLPGAVRGGQGRRGGRAPRRSCRTCRTGSRST